MKKYELDLVNFIRDKDNFSQWLWGYMFLGPSILIIILKYGFQMDIEFNFILYMTFFISTMISSIYRATCKSQPEISSHKHRFQDLS
jgi:hypothetical protein